MGGSSSGGASSGGSSTGGSAGTSSGGTSGTGGSATGGAPTGGAGGATGSGTCNASNTNATVVAMQTVLTLPENTCLKIEFAADQSWRVKVTFQAQEGTMPLPMSWSNCTKTGSGTISAINKPTDVVPVDPSCALYVQLGGGTTDVKLQWW